MKSEVGLRQKFLLSYFFVLTLDRGIIGIKKFSFLFNTVLGDINNHKPISIALSGSVYRKNLISYLMRKNEEIRGVRHRLGPEWDA